MPLLVDSEDALVRALALLPAAARASAQAELAAVAERAADTAASRERRQLAEALVLALASGVRDAP